VLVLPAPRADLAISATSRRCSCIRDFCSKPTPANPLHSLIVFGTRGPALGSGRTLLVSVVAILVSAPSTPRWASVSLALQIVPLNARRAPVVSVERGVRVPSTAVGLRHSVFAAERAFFFFLGASWSLVMGHYSGFRLRSSR